MLKWVVIQSPIDPHCTDPHIELRMVSLDSMYSVENFRFLHNFSSFSFWLISFVFVQICCTFAQFIVNFAYEYVKIFYNSVIGLIFKDKGEYWWTVSSEFRLNFWLSLSNIQPFSPKMRTSNAFIAEFFKQNEQDVQI